MVCATNARCVRPPQSLRSLRRQRGLSELTISPTLAVVSSYTLMGDAGEPRLVATNLDGGLRTLMSGPQVGKMHPSVISTTNGTFLAAFEYVPDAGPAGIYTMEFCAP